jgi:hypothetical protein
VIREGSWVSVPLSGRGIPAGARGFGQVVSRRSLFRGSLLLTVLWAPATRTAYPQLPLSSAVDAALAAPMPLPPEPPVRALAHDAFAARMRSKRG